MMFMLSATDGVGPQIKQHELQVRGKLCTRIKTASVLKAMKILKAFCEC